ncbi:phosphatidylinositol glycan anchor biosynthesis class H isoform X2 [Dermacentor variabilis]|uniref:phosphatidylinositol glycan anchor biosynthesis class H isoform X2 n=1 Tax=Dermacentor variabilis TaxID=34621 RepID=UPI003F5C04E9
MTHGIRGKAGRKSATAKPAVNGNAVGSSSIFPCENVRGEPLDFCAINYGKNLVQEYIFRHRTFNTKRWLVLTPVFLLCFLHFGLHTRGVDILGLSLIVLCLLLVVKLRRRVKEESLLVMRSLGLQTTTTFVTGRQESRFINSESIEDVVISEAISMHSVIFYLVILLHNVDSKVPSLVPLFQNTMPRLDALKMVYRGIHDSSWSLQQ